MFKLKKLSLNKNNNWFRNLKYTITYSYSEKSSHIINIRIVMNIKWLIKIINVIIK